jgi:hypothetical protein
VIIRKLPHIAIDMASGNPPTGEQAALTTTFLSLPAEIRAKIYSHLIPVTTTMAVSARDTSQLKSDLSSRSSETPPLLALAQSHVRDPASNHDFLKSFALEYSPISYRFSGLSRLFANSDRPAFHELALTCRTLYQEMVPEIAGSLKIMVDTIPEACVLAARLGSTAPWVRDVLVRRPFMAGMNSDEAWDKRTAGYTLEEGVEYTKSWIEVMADLLPGLKKLTFACVARRWVTGALLAGADNDRDEAEESPDDRWGWDPNQLQIMREVTRAWEAKGQVLTPASTRQSAGVRQMLVVWEVRTPGNKDDLTKVFGSANGKTLDEEWTAYEQWTQQVRVRWEKRKEAEQLVSDQP